MCIIYHLYGPFTLSSNALHACCFLSKIVGSKIDGLLFHNGKAMFMEQKVDFGGLSTLVCPPRRPVFINGTKYSLAFLISLGGY